METTLTQMTTEDWNALHYFSKKEFDCQHTGNNEMKLEFIKKLEQLREACDFPFVITSGYRDKTHPIEAKKSTVGTHAQGIACDIAVNGGNQRYIIAKEAAKLGFNGIGVAKGFMHVDTRETTPVMWVY